MEGRFLHFNQIQSILLALYTNIPHIDGITRVAKFIRNHGATPQEIELCETLLPHILQKNYFQFNDKIYLQISGTAIAWHYWHNALCLYLFSLFRQSVLPEASLAMGLC